MTDRLVWDGENWQKCIDADTSDGSVAWRKARADWVLGGRKGKAPRTARAGATLFGNSGRLGVIQQAIFTNASYDTDRQRWYLTEGDEARFVTANPASMYLLAMCGPHLGVEAKGYDRINMASVEALWEWSRHVTDGYMEDGKLREMEFTVNGYLTDEVKESELVARVLTAARSFQTIDDEGRYMVVIDKKRDWPVMQINQENALELSNSRSFGKDVSGLKVTFTDANDGWQKNIIYAMADGESIEVHTGDIEDKKFDWVTDPVQAWSLARYELARKLQQKEVITRTLGMAGMSVRLGDLVEVSDTTLLIGDGTGRINKFIQDDEWLYGFTIDGHFELVFQADGSCKQGVSVTRISNHGRARVMTLALAGEKGVIDKDGHVRGTNAGMTSTAILAEPISLKTGLAKDAPEGGAEFRPKIADIAAFGEIGKITSEYVVGKIEPQDDFKFRLTLWQYSPLMYEYGAALPSFQSNMSIPDRSSDGLELELGPSWNDLANAQAGTISTLQQWVEGQLHGDEYEPGPAEVTLARAEKEGIVVTCSPDVNVGMRNTPKKVHWQMQGWDKAGDATTWDSESVESGYMFDRARDGYPEAEELYSVKIRCRVTNTYGKTGAWSEWKTVDADDYGTWIPQSPRVRVKTDNRAVMMTVEQPVRSDGRKLYGDVVNSVLVRREDPTRDPIYALDSNGERIKEGTGYKMTDSDYKGSGERQYFKPVTGASYADGVDNYKDGVGDHNDKDKRVDCYDEYRQIMPLAGQGFAGYSRREEWTPRGADAPTGSMTYLQVNEHDILNDEEHGVPDDVQIKPPSTEYDPYPCSTFSNGADMAGGNYDTDYGRLCRAEFRDTGYRVKFMPLMLQVRDKNGETGYLAIERNIAALFFAREK